MSKSAVLSDFGLVLPGGVGQFRPVSIGIFAGYLQLSYPQGPFAAERPRTHPLEVHQEESRVFADWITIGVILVPGGDLKVTNEADFS